MSRREMRWLRLAVLPLAAVVLALSPTVARPAAADGPVQITVKITDDGFDPNTIEVQLGQSVELTFEWAQKTHPTDEHIIIIDSYKLESDKISAAKTQTTLKFIATNAGTFTFKCDIDCDIHSSLQHGQLKVTAAPGGATTAALQPSKLSVEPGNVLVKGASMTVSAFLLDAVSGQPIPKAEVALLSQEQFVGKSALVEVALARTDQAGLAKFDFTPTHAGAQKLVARFDGLGLYDKTEQAIENPGDPSFGPAAIASGTDNLHGIKGLAHEAFLLVILGIWSILGFSLYQAWRISRIGDEGNP
jgi:plastocyanin